MAQRLILTDNSLLIDFRMVFKAIREEKGDWKKVEKELEAYFQSLREDTQE
jgi:hypothetical protein